MEAGTTLAGKYRLVSMLGQGGMGSVWRAEHLGLNAPVAIKLIDPSIADNEEALGRFHREAQAAATLRSPHVVQILDHGVDKELNAPFIVMELMEGESLGDRLERVGALSPQQTSKILTQVARALTRAHQAGIVHRDLKPDNIFLVNNFDDEIAKVLDFGVAKASPNSLHSGMATRTGMVMGTPYYMSPEQISGSKDVDHRTDLWALAVIVAQCLTGRLLFTADTIGGLTLKICMEPIPEASSLGPVPAGFDAWLAKSVAREMSQRFDSAAEMAAAFRDICGGTLGAFADSGAIVSGVGQTVHAPSDALQASHPGSGGYPGTTGQQLRSSGSGISAESVGPLSNTTGALVPRRTSPALIGAAVVLSLGMVAAGAFVVFKATGEAGVDQEEVGADVESALAPTAELPATSAKPAPAVAPANVQQEPADSGTPEPSASKVPRSVAPKRTERVVPPTPPPPAARPRVTRPTPPAPAPAARPRPQPKPAFDGILDDRH